MRALVKAAEDAPRPYRFVLLGDHGQSLGATFRQRYGKTLQEYVAKLMGGATDVAAATGRVEEWGALNAAVTEASRASGATGAMTRAAFRSRIRGRRHRPRAGGGTGRPRPATRPASSRPSWSSAPAATSA